MARVFDRGKSVVIRVTTFNDNTFDNIKDGLDKELEKAGGLENINGVVIDLWNNPGGLLSQAIRVSDAFLEKGEIVSTRGRTPEDGDRYNATPGDLIDGKPIVVLINGGSARIRNCSCSFKRSQERDRCRNKSFGKGSVQTVMPLREQSAMRLTTARYYSPSGRSIQNLGVIP